MRKTMNKFTFKKSALIKRFALYFVFTAIGIVSYYLLPNVALIGAEYSMSEHYVARFYIYLYLISHLVIAAPIVFLPDKAVVIAVLLVAIVAVTNTLKTYPKIKKNPEYYMEYTPYQKDKGEFIKVHSYKSI